MTSTQKRHIVKTITWRIIGTLDTIILSWVISGNPLTGLKIGAAEVISKMILYYLHERLWFKSEASDSKWRHILKTISWRFVGTMDTMLLAWLISGDPMIGLQIGFAEVITKMLFYYLHEKLWYKSNYGLEETDRNTRTIE
ncbi:DUF2061 domain-containing protein [Salegentibacter flavus]|uniref:Uncharacterized membrane protein n=1 Tax=Salegentibacter flavus TaxID=287099 RepID=A0A1I5BNR4_9FLAO|nr:DUF2061 domain-containing protein [Salegentibacter flavus]SFN76256.1 Uncharacterized membrane protein [Salegentibacter flavus]